MQIVYFPFIKMGRTQEVDFGFLKIWNYDLLSDKYIADSRMRNRVSTIITSNQNYFTGPIKGIGVVSIGNPDFRAFTSEEFELIREARLILFLSYLSRNNVVKLGPNAGLYLATSENFETTVQNFNVNDDNLSTIDGYIVTTTKMGYRNSQYKAYEPNYVLTPLDFELDEKLFNSLLTLRLKKPRLFHKLINSMELFSESYYNSHLVSINARILCQMAAFEMLLNLPEHQQRRAFKDKVESETAFANEQKYPYYFESTNKKKAKETRTIKGIWADKFYTLRNHIIHGLEIPKDQYNFRKSQRHVEIALLFFVFFIKQQINSSFGKRIFVQSINWENYTDVLSGMTRPIFKYR
jgi:hypothetical protein